MDLESNPSGKNLAAKADPSRMVQVNRSNYVYLSNRNNLTKMNQERPLTMRQKILEALAKGNMSSKEIAEHLKCDVEKTKHMRPELVRKGLIEEVGSRLNKDGKGTEKIWGLVQGGKKVKAVNAFDWRNWETEAHFSAREIAYSYSQFSNKKESRVIVYSRA